MVKKLRSEEKMVSGEELADTSIYEERTSAGEENG